MADTWAENNADAQDVPLDDQNLGDFEAGANRDNVNANEAKNDPNVNDETEEGARPKRNRAPTIGHVDDNPEDGNLDGVPKPKRGRGRPKKDDDSQLNVAIRKELEDIRNENARLSELLRKCNSEKDEMEKDLDLTRSSLLEKEHDYAELLDQFSSHEENSAAQSAIKPNGIIFYDDITECCISKLKSSINWNKIKKGLLDISETDEIKSADVVVILTGASEIASDKSAFHLLQSLRRLLADVGEQTLIYLVTLPPNNNARVQVDLYNHKLCSMDGENLKVLKIKFLGSKLDLVSYNGYSLNSKCISLYDDALQSVIAPPSLKSKELPVEPMKSDFNVTAVIPIKPELVGRIIGRNGSVIKKITSDYKVKMSFGNWREKSNENRDEDPESFTAVMIKGLAHNVNQATSMVNEIIGSKPNK